MYLYKVVRISQLKINCFITYHTLKKEEENGIKFRMHVSDYFQQHGLILTIWGEAPNSIHKPPDMPVRI